MLLIFALFTCTYLCMQIPDDAFCNLAKYCKIKIEHNENSFFITWLSRVILKIVNSETKDLLRSIEQNLLRFYNELLKEITSNGNCY